MLLVLGEIMEESAKKRGGRRPGAGRKKSTVKRYGFNAPATVHAVLQQVDSITDFICEAVLKYGQDKGLCWSEWRFRRLKISQAMTQWKNVLQI